MVGSTLVVTGRRAVTEIDVATGVATVTPGTPPYPREEMPAPARLVAGFDATLSRLLWLSDLAYGEWRFGLVDGVVVFVQHVRLDIQTDMTRPDTAAFD
jgi:hypothetical protein